MWCDVMWCDVMWRDVRSITLERVHIRSSNFETAIVTANERSSSKMGMLAQFVACQTSKIHQKTVRNQIDKRWASVMKVKFRDNDYNIQAKLKFEDGYVCTIYSPSNLRNSPNLVAKSKWQSMGFEPDTSELKYTITMWITHQILA